MKGGLSSHTYFLLWFLFTSQQVVELLHAHVVSLLKGRTRSLRSVQKLRSHGEQGGELEQGGCPAGAGARMGDEDVAARRKKQNQIGSAFRIH